MSERLADMPMSDPTARGLCPTCGQDVHDEDFRDDESRKEAMFSGMCQPCQDDFFGTQSQEPAPNQCIGCGMPAASGDVFCPGCRDGHEYSDLNGNTIGDWPEPMERSAAGWTRLVQPLTCPSCESTNTRGRYQRGGWRQYSCGDCGNEFRSQKSKEGHASKIKDEIKMAWVREAHIDWGIKTATCEDCGSESDVSPWTSGHKICGACRASYEVEG